MQHPRTLGRDWLKAIHVPPERLVEDRLAGPTAPPHAALGRVDELRLIPTSDETRRLLGVPVHVLAPSELAAWNSADEHDRDEARPAIREAVRELGGGELRDARGRVIERVE